MKFSRNPDGILEVYTDEGIYVGVMATSNVPRESFAQDGGPGSGNFGHAGRPGKVGGSQPSGGKGSGSLYRYEKKGVGFFGTRKDWLNGLEGEQQHKAVRFIAQKKREMQEALQKKDNIERLWKDGHLTRSEADERLKELGLFGINEKSPVEEYILQSRKNTDIHDLLDYAAMARNWEENYEELMKRNLSPEEQKVWDYLWRNSYDKSENVEVWWNLHAKTLGIPHNDVEIPEELLYASGVKARPKENFNWFGPECNLTGWERDTYFPRIVQLAAGIKGDDIEDHPTKETINDALQNAVTLLNVEEKPNIGRMEEVLKYVAKAKNIDWRRVLIEAVRGENVDGLTQDETDELVSILKKKDEDNDINKSPQIIESYFIFDGSVNEDNRRYALLKAKALGLPEPETKEIFEEKARKAKEARKQKAKEFVDGGKERRVSYQQADTRFKLKQTLESSGIFKPKAAVTFDSIDLECARNAAIRADAFVQMFPFLYGKLNGIDNKQGGSTVYACSHRMSDDGRVSLNPGQIFFGNERGIIAQYADDVRKGFHPVGTGYDSVVTHEFAHSLGGWLTRNKVFGSDTGSEGRQFESKLRLSVLKKLKMTKAMVGKELSNYAEKDSYEWFAEAMAEAIHSPNPRPMATECFNQLSDILQKEGLIDGPLQRIL